MDPKKPWLSKTLWVNFLLSAAVLAIPGAEAYVASNPQLAILVAAAVNVVLRLVTKEPVGLGK